MQRQLFLLKLCFVIFVASLFVVSEVVHAPYADDGRLFPLASPIKKTYVTTDKGLRIKQLLPQD